MTTPSDTFDVFLSHNSKDKSFVRKLATELEHTYQLKVWYDEYQLQGGIAVQPLLEAGLRKSKSVIVVVGRFGLGNWEALEQQAAIALAIQDGRPVIPVLLPSVPEALIPLFLQQRHWIQLKEDLTRHELNEIYFGVTGQRFLNDSVPMKEPLPRPSILRSSKELCRRHAHVLALFSIAVLCFGVLVVNSFGRKPRRFAGDENDVGAYHRLTQVGSKYRPFFKDRVLSYKNGDNLHVYLTPGDIMDFVREDNPGKKRSDSQWAVDAMVMSTNETLEFGADNPMVQGLFRDVLGERFSDGGNRIRQDVDTTFRNYRSRFKKLDHVTKCLSVGPWDAVSPRQICFLSTDQATGGTYRLGRWLTVQLDEENVATGIRDCLIAAAADDATSVVIPFVGSSKIVPGKSLKTPDEQIAHILRRAISLKGVLRGIRQHCESAPKSTITKISIVIWTGDIDELGGASKELQNRMRDEIVNSFDAYASSATALPAPVKYTKTELMIPDDE